MEVSQLYTYPIKSLRGVPLSSTQVTRRGFPHDRTFMLLKVQKEGDGQLNCMIIGKVSELALFTQDLKEDQGILRVTFHPPDGSQERHLEVPLQPDSKDLKETIDTNLHGSPTKAFDMGPQYNKWFSDCFGYEVVLAYIGPNNERQILGSLDPNKQSQSWTASITTGISNRIFGGAGEKNSLTFADVGNYLIVTEESLADVSSRLPEGEEMDVTKFRPNIVVKGSPKAWDEDMWGILSIRGEEIKITASCHRCQSIDVSYKTGQYNKGSSGVVLKRLMKDRRVDPGAKYSPVFGRYGFLMSSPFEINVGDEIEVTERFSEQTVWDWPDVGSLEAKLVA